MKIAVVGTRGFPGIAGGVETHCEELYTRLAQAGVDVTVMRRRPYVASARPADSCRGVKFIDLWAPRSKALEALVHTMIGVVRARREGADIVHIHAVGPALATPLARLMGMKVVMTHHGRDYERAKWGRVARAMLRLGERLGARLSHGLIAVSPDIAATLSRRYGRYDTAVICNGVTLPPHDGNDAPARGFVESLGLTPGGYIMAAGRFVPEKGFHDLIEAYTRLPERDAWRLVIAGDADHPDSYSTALRQQAIAAGAVLTGRLPNADVRRLMAEAALFVLPSYHEGLPITLLEAMSHERDVVVSDIAANRLPVLDPTDFFKAGSVESLTAALSRKLARAPRRCRYDLSAYDWDNIAALTLDVYERISRPTT